MSRRRAPGRRRCWRFCGPPGSGCDRCRVYTSLWQQHPGIQPFCIFSNVVTCRSHQIACASAANNAQQTHRLFAPLRISRFSSFCQESCISLTFCRLIMGLLLLIPNVTFGKIKPTLSGIVLPDHQPLPAFTSCVLELDFYSVSLNSETVFLR